MRLVFDLQAAQSHQSQGRGLGRYAADMTTAIIQCIKKNKLDIDCRVVLNLAYRESLKKVENLLEKILPKNHISYFSPIQTIQDSSLSHMINEDLMQYHYAHLHPDAVFLPSVFEGFNESIYLPSSLMALPHTLGIATVHDLIPKIFENEYLRSEKIKKWYHYRLEVLKKVSLLLADSESTKKDIISHLSIDPEKITVLYPGVNSLFERIDLSSEDRLFFLKKYNIRNKFFLYVGGEIPRKNMERLILAYAQLPDLIRQTHQLVIICSLSVFYKKSLLSLSKKSGLKENELILPGFVSDPELVYFYNLCHLFIFPSLYEGFGLPVVEAMACGAPVIGSNTSSIPELIANKGCLFDPHDVSSIACMIEKTINNTVLLEDLKKQNQKIAGNFSAEKTAELFLLAFQKKYNHQSKQKYEVANQLPRRKIAYCSPLPRQASGIANYSAVLLPELKKYYDIDLYVDHFDKKVEGACLGDNFSIFPWQKLPQAYETYDSVLYHMGNSHFHFYMHDLMKLCPGIVVLHDFFLGNSLAVFYRTQPQQYQDALIHSHGYQSLSLLEKTEGFYNTAMHYPTNRPVLESSEGLIFHSPYALELIKKYYPEGIKTPKKIIRSLYHVKEKPSFSEKKSARVQLGLDPDALFIGTFGIVSPLKCIKKLVNIFLKIEFHKKAKVFLIIVGEFCDEVYLNEVRNLVKGSIFRDRVLFIGNAFNETYYQYVAATDIAVQLRTHTRGETSGAVLDCLAHGIPTIMNDYATFKDYPNDICVKISEEAPEQELLEALTCLIADTSLRNRIGDLAHHYVKRYHLASHIAKEYAVFIEEIIQIKKITCENKIIEKIGKNLSVYHLFEEQVHPISENIFYSRLPFRLPRILFDCSFITKIDGHGGIQRVLKKIFKELLNNKSINILPVYLKDDAFFHATVFLNAAMESDIFFSQEKKIEILRNDIFLNLDTNWSFFSDYIPIIERIHSLNGRIVTAIYDIIPIKYSAIYESKIFKSWLALAIKYSDALVCISKTVADDVIHYVKEHALMKNRSFPLEINYFHQGADFYQPSSSVSIHKTLKDFLHPSQSQPIFLMVGALDFRKNHNYVLNAFEKLWVNTQAKLCILGRLLGKVEENLLDRLRYHPEMSHRLLWLDDASDSDLMYAYQHTDAFIQASLEEGFGLPMIEAAQHQLPIFCSDIPIFHEIAKEYPIYFSLNSPIDLVEKIEKWLADGRPSAEQPMTWLTWKESAERLLNIIMKNESYKTLVPVSEEVVT